MTRPLMAVRPVGYIVITMGYGVKTSSKMLSKLAVLDN